MREPAALEEALRRARAIAAKSRELAEERGILTGFLAIGMATWAVRLPDGRAAPRAPADGPGTAGAGVVGRSGEPPRQPSMVLSRLCAARSR